MKTITSRQNAWVQRVRDAMRDPHEEIVVEGPKQVADAIASGWKPVAVFERGSSLSDAHIGIAPAIFDSLSGMRAPQELLALFPRPHATFAQLLARRDSIIVALDGIQDPGNVGTIVRLAAAFDAAGIALLPGCTDAFSAKAIRASTGTIVSVPIADVTSEDLIASGLPIFAADANGRDTDPPSAAAILVLGSEGSGVSPDLLRSASPIAIPMSTRAESLNVAAAAAILLSRSFTLRRVG